MTAAISALAWCCPALADSTGSPLAQDSSLPNLPAYLRLITDWGGVRSKLERDGVQFIFRY